MSLPTRTSLNVVIPSERYRRSGDHRFLFMERRRRGVLASICFLVF